MVINTSNIPELLGFTNLISEAHIQFSYKKDIPDPGRVPGLPAAS